MPEPASSPYDASALQEGCERIPEARERLQGQIRACYGVRTAEEELLLERVVDLTWRLRETAQALGAQARLGHLSAMRRAESLPPPTTTEQPAVLDAWDPRRLRLGISRVDTLAEDLPVPSMCPAPPDIRRVLTHLVGSDRMIFGLDGCGPLRDLCHWEDWLELTAQEEEEVARGGEPALPEDNLPVQPPYTWAEELGKLRVRLEARLDEALAREAARRTAHVEADGLPHREDLKVVPRYERDLARQLEQATRELREAVGRRRLGEIGRAWLRGR